MLETWGLLETWGSPGVSSGLDGAPWKETRLLVRKHQLETEFH